VSEQRADEKVRRLFERGDFLQIDPVLDGLLDFCGQEQRVLVE